MPHSPFHIYIINIFCAINFGDFIKFTWCKSNFHFISSSEHESVQAAMYSEISVTHRNILRSEEEKNSLKLLLVSKHLRLIAMFHVSNSRRNKICAESIVTAVCSHCLAHVIKRKSINSSKSIYFNKYG